MQYLLDTQRTIFSYEKNAKEKRKELVATLLKLNERYCHEPSIYFLSVAILDRYISKKTILPHEYKNIVLASFKIAYCSIYESDFCIEEETDDNGDIDKEVVNILLFLNFHIFIPTPYSFLQFFLKDISFIEKEKIVDLLKLASTITSLVMYFPFEIFQACYNIVTKKSTKITVNVKKCMEILTEKKDILFTEVIENDPKDGNPITFIVKSSITASQLKECKCIASGQYGKVCANKKNVFKIYTQGYTYINMTIRDIATLRYFTAYPHKNIISMKSYFFSLEFAISEMQKFPYTLADYRKKFVVCEKNNIFLMKQLVEGLCFMHENGFIHRDLKPSNIVIDYNLNLKIIDMGLSRKIDGIKQVSSTSVITCCYRPLELFKEGSLVYGYEVDIWSLGCIFYEILTGKPLSSGITDRTVKVDLENKFGYSSKSVQYAEKVTYKNIESIFRKEGKEIVNDSYISLLLSTLQINPKYRLTCRDILEHPIFSL